MDKFISDPALRRLAAGWDVGKKRAMAALFCQWAAELQRQAEAEEERQRELERAVDLRWQQWRRDQQN